MKMALGTHSTANMVGAIFNSGDRKRGEKQRTNSLYYDFSDDLDEQGEIEDGEIVDSQDEDAGGIRPIANLTSSQMPNSNGTSMFLAAATVRSGMDFDDIPDILPTTGKKKKKKRKKKRPLALLMEMGDAAAAGDAALDNLTALGHAKGSPAKKKRKVYVDHDKVDDNEQQQEASWYKFRPSNKVGRQQVCPPINSNNQYDAPPPQPDDFDSTPFGRSPPPVRRRSRSPPGLYDSPYESDENEDVPPNYGGGWRFDDNAGPQGHDGPQDDNDDDRGGQRQQRMRGKRNHNAGRGRNKKRGGKGRGGGGGGRGKQQQRREKTQPICKFYLEGKCHKGSDCIFKHDGDLTKKRDICKFYLNSFCSKGDSCIYMHHPHEYPCKFFHTGAPCYSAENCKFSHDPLTNETRLLLEKCLDKGDDDDDDNNREGMMMMDDGEPGGPASSGLLRSPPRNYGQQDQQSCNMDMNKGIPSLFDIQVDVPKDGGGPPSQLSPSKQMQKHNNNSLGFYAETLNINNNNNGPRAPLLPLPYGAGAQAQTSFSYEQLCRSQGMMGNAPPGSGGGRSSDGLSGKAVFNHGRDYDGRDFDHGCKSLDMDERVPYFGSNVQDTDMRLRQMRNNAGGSGEPGSSSWRNQAPNDMDNNRNYYDSGGEEFDRWDMATTSSSTSRSMQQQKVRNRSYNSSGSESETSVKKEAMAATSSTSVTAASMPSTAVEPNADNGGLQIPIHLPKKQRELFLRIQQQQREAERNIQAHKKEAMTKDESDEIDRDGGKMSVEQEDRGGYNDDDDEDIYNDIYGAEGKKSDDDKAGGDSEGDEDKEKWYSSDDDDDDEDQPLTAVLKKLQQQPIPKQEEQQQQKPLTSVFNIAKMLQSISSQSPTKGSGSSSSPSLSSSSSTGVVPDLSRDPRAQRHVPTFRDPRGASRGLSSNVSVDSSSRDPRSKLSNPPADLKFKDIVSVPSSSSAVSNVVATAAAAAASSSSSSRHGVDVFIKSQTSPPPPPPPSAAPPLLPLPLPPSAATVLTQQLPPASVMRKERKPSLEMRSPEYLMPYKLIPVSAVSHIDYGYMLSSSELDPTLLLKDPRLTRQLANKINSQTSDPKRKAAKDNAAKGGDLNKGHAKVEAAKHGLHRLGVVTMPGPGGPGSMISFGRNLHQQQHKPASAPNPARQTGSLDDVDELWSVDEDNDLPNLSSGSSSRVHGSNSAGSPGHIKDYKIAKKSSSRLLEDSSFSSGSGQPAKIRGGSYQRKGSMEYASPLGYDDDVKNTQKHSLSSGYESANRVPIKSSSYVRQRGSLELPPRGGTGSPPDSKDTSGAADAPSGGGTKPLKEMFKTIDPTASPFC